MDCGVLVLIAINGYDDIDEIPVWLPTLLIMVQYMNPDGPLCLIPGRIGSQASHARDDPMGCENSSVTIHGYDPPPSSINIGGCGVLS